MGQKITLTLDRTDADVLAKSLRRRRERLCDIRRELCEEEEFEREELAYFEHEDEVIRRILTELGTALESASRD